MFPVEITYRHTETSRALSENINARAHKLEKFYDHILNCHVTIEAPPQKHQHQSQLFKVSIQLGVPGNDIIVHRDAAAHSKDEDVYTTVNKTFAALRRRLEDHVNIQRDNAKRGR
ncbi:MAG: ribosome-associated translation inhibitor RaiA [Gammaproteobacteria bacterium]|nr:ribosome-associated translation inhibitor RaiA [Gammaproteobacteria bacterium]